MSRTTCRQVFTSSSASPSRRQRSRCAGFGSAASIRRRLSARLRGQFFPSRELARRHVFRTDQPHRNRRAGLRRRADGWPRAGTRTRWHRRAATPRAATLVQGRSTGRRTCLLQQRLRVEPIATQPAGPSRPSMAMAPASTAWPSTTRSSRISRHVFLRARCTAGAANLGRGKPARRFPATARIRCRKVHGHCSPAQCRV